MTGATVRERRGRTRRSVEEVEDLKVDVEVK
jgi:hypothetical protein